MQTLKIGSLFSGIGGLELGLERGLNESGIDTRVAWQCEIEDYPRRVLAKHWPDTRRYTDVRTMGVNEELEHVDIICGGFPCQDLSYAGKRAGLGGERSGLFWELMRIVRLVGPRYVVLENVPGLLTADQGEAMGSVLGALAESGYDAEWDCIPAAAVGAPHRRDRVFVVAYSKQDGRVNDEAASDPLRLGDAGHRQAKGGDQQAILSRSSSQVWLPIINRVANDCRWYKTPEPDRLSVSTMDGVANGISTRMDRSRLAALGNAVVPQVAQVLGRRIAKIEGAR